MKPSTPRDTRTPRRRALVLLATMGLLGAASAAIETWLSPALRQSRDAADAPEPSGGASPAGAQVPTAPGGAAQAGPDDGAAEPADEGGGATSAPDTAAPAKRTVQEMTPEELEAEMEAVKAATEPAQPDERERNADQPLPVDLGLALPSDF